jgi:hypothetical protein
MRFHGISIKVQFSELIGKSAWAEVYANIVETEPILRTLRFFASLATS